MVKITTFGFEAEFQINAPAVLAALYDRGFAGDRAMHGYHCDCSVCDFDTESGFLFRGQNDSSCSGELISNILEWTHGQHIAFGVLADCAVETDAEPGPNSGFHVHVGLDEQVGNELAEAFWQFVRWEAVLERIAGGRWPNRRDGMNRTVRESCAGMFGDMTDIYSLRTQDILVWERADMSDYDRADIKYRLMDYHRNNDRHSNLNVRQAQHPTWEFRLWNSTRSAWRMELFCGLSVAFLDPAVVDGLSQCTPPQRMRQPDTGISDIHDVLVLTGYTRTAELLERQAAYLVNRAGTAPSALTVL